MRPAWFQYIRSSITRLRRRFGRARLKRRLRGVKERLARDDRAGAVEELRRAGALAVKSRDPSGMNQVGLMLQRLGVFEPAWRLRIAIERLRQQDSLPEWDGSDLSGRSILIRANAHRNRIGEDMRYARFIGPVSEQAQRCIVLAESRMVPILRRTFPRAEIRPYGSDDAAAAAEAEIAAGFGTLALHLARQESDLLRSLVRLKADREQAEAFRRRYRSESPGPLIGLSWSSKKSNRDRPDPDNLEPLLAANSATFVSLQYGDVADDVARLQELSGGRFIHDASVDQLRDLDRFAAQIAALDAVVSITNTTIDLAGSLGVPTVQIRDDRSYGIWPPSGRSPWYPDIVPVYRNRRAWPLVAEEISARLAEFAHRRE